MKHHEVKAWTRFFEGYANGTKPWSIRKNDRDYRAGDFLTIHEFDAVTKTYTGRNVTTRIVAVWDAQPFIAHDQVVLSLEPPKLQQTKQRGES